jgi:hypothetical protein
MLAQVPNSSSEISPTHLDEWAEHRDHAPTIATFEADSPEGEG